MKPWRAVVGDLVEPVPAVWLRGGRIGFPVSSTGQLARLVSTGSPVRLEQDFRWVAGSARVHRSGRWHAEVQARLRDDVGRLDRLRRRRTDAVVVLETAYAEPFVVVPTSRETAALVVPTV